MNFQPHVLTKLHILSNIAIISGYSCDISRDFYKIALLIIKYICKIVIHIFFFHLGVNNISTD